MPFGLNYRDYLSNAPGLNASENATTPMSEAEWNAMPMEQQWGLLGYGSQGLGINHFDPRYQGLGGDAAGGDNRDIHVMPGTFGSNVNNEGVQRFRDPAQVQQGNGYYQSASSNATPEVQKQGGLSDKQWGVLAATLMAGGPALAGAMGAGAGAAGAAGAAGELVGPSAGLMNFGLDAIPALESTTLGGLGEGGLLSSGAAGSGGLLGGAADGGMMSAGGYGNAGMIAPGMGNSAAADSFLINNGMSGLAGGNLTGALSPAAWPGIGSNAVNAAIRNPLQTYGLIRSGVGLLTGNQGNSGSPGGSGSKSAGGTGVPAKVERPQFQPNPYLLQQLQRGGYSHP